MNSSHDHILCKSDPTTLRQALNFQENLVPSLVSFIEANVLQVFEQATSEVKDKLYKHILTTPISHEVLAIPFQSDLCIPVIRSSVTPLSQILGSDDDSQIPQVMLGFFIYLSQSGTKAINFDEFLAEEISSQLANFHKVAHFRFQVYLCSMIISANKQVLMEMDSELFRHWPLVLLPAQDWSFTQFIEKVVLSIFRLFDPKISRISKEVKSFIHPDLIGSWFLSKDHSLIRVFGFSAVPLILHVFLTSNVFSLELMRQRLHQILNTLLHLSTRRVHGLSILLLLVIMF